MNLWMTLPLQPLTWAPSRAPVKLVAAWSVDELSALMDLLLQTGGRPPARATCTGYGDAGSAAGEALGVSVTGDAVSQATVAISEPRSTWVATSAEMSTGSSLPIIAQDGVPMRVFVSYSRRDSEFVDRLDEALTQLGYDLWIDREDISGSGDDRWRHSIVRAIHECDAMMLVLSSNSVVSENVDSELSVASDNDKRVVPVRHQPCELPVGLQYELSGVQYVDFTTVGFTEAVRQLSARLGPATGPSAGVTPTASTAAAGPIGPVSPTRARRWRQLRTYAVMSVIVGIVVVAAIVALIGGDDKRNTDFPPGTDNGPAIGEAFTLAGPPVAFNPGDHFVLTMGNRIS